MNLSNFFWLFKLMATTMYYGACIKYILLYKPLINLSGWSLHFSILRKASTSYIVLQVPFMSFPNHPSSFQTEKPSAVVFPNYGRMFFLSWMYIIHHRTRCSHKHISKEHQKRWQSHFFTQTSTWKSSWGMEFYSVKTILKVLPAEVRLTSPPS